MSHLQPVSYRAPRSSTFCTSCAIRGQKDLDEKVEGKILSRLMEEPAVKRFKENSANLEHFKVVNQSAAVTVVEEKPHEEYTLPHPIWSQVHPNTPMLTLTHSVILSMKLR